MEPLAFPPDLPPVILMVVERCVNKGTVLNVLECDLVDERFGRNAAVGDEKFVDEEEGKKAWEEREGSQ